jgi:hypothetical protein
MMRASDTNLMETTSPVAPSPQQFERHFNDFKNFKDDYFAKLMNRFYTSFDQVRDINDF